MSKVVPSPRPAPAGTAVGISPKEEEEKVVAADSPRGSEQSSAGNAALAATSDGRAAGAASGTPDKGTQKMFEMLAERSARANKFRAMTETANTRDALTSYDIQRIINGIPAELRLEIAKVFAIIDDDSSGAISMDELASMFRDLGKPQSTRGMKAMFRVIDADRNGEIDFFEFQLLFWKLHQKVAFEADTLHGSHEEIAAAQAEAASLRRISAESIGNVDADGEEDTDLLRPTCRETLWAIMEHPSSSRVALIVSIIIMGLILLSTVMFLLESYAPPKNYQVDPLDAPYYIELVCVIAFTVEF